MTAWVASGRVLDWILLAMLAEAASLWGAYRVFRRGVPPAACLPSIAAGMCLLLAMRLALAGAWWGFVSATLFGGLAFHLVDLRRQWR